MSARRAGAKSGRGTLVIIGGHEDKEGPRDILREVARLNGDRPLVIATLASHTREGYFESYQQGFADLDVGPLRELYLDERDDARQADTLDLLADAGGLFFSGGDQLRITSLLAQTPLDDRVRALYDSGGVVAGTSAGASVLCETMLVSGHSDETYRVGEVQMAPGLGLIRPQGVCDGVSAFVLPQPVPVIGGPWKVSPLGVSESDASASALEQPPPSSERR